jgi:hypothetical protein
MKTDDLIRSLALDAASTVSPPERTGGRALIVAVPLAAVVFLAILGPRPDFLASLSSARFLFKFAASLSLFASMAHATLRLARPEGRPSGWTWVLPPLLVAAGVLLEWQALPAGSRAAAAIGSNALLCLLSIPTIGLAPLVVFLIALRRAATTRPALTGALAGLMAGGLAATFYAAHCPDDSPFFVGIWYTLAVGELALVGALAGRRLLRW